jgi:hypothetical protein
LTCNVPNRFIVALGGRLKLVAEFGHDQLRIA